MRLDANFQFVPLGGNLSLIAAAGVAVPSTNTLDLLGAGVGVAPPSIIGNAALFGTDMGVGRYRQYIEAIIGTALATSTSALLNVALQLAPDTGAAGSYQPGTWQTVNESGQITAAQGAANTIIRLDFAPVFPVTLRPRFCRLLFQVQVAAGAALGLFTAGTISSAFVTPTRDDQANRQAASNYTVR